MAEQHTTVNDIHADKVTISPTQIVIGASGSAARGWMEALMQGPLEQAGLAQRAADARGLQDEGRNAEAADAFKAIADSLDNAGYEPAALAYLERAAAAYADAREGDAACREYLLLARKALGDGSLRAQSYARRARIHASPDVAWEADGLIARAAWPERPQGDVDALQVAWERTSGTDAEVEWGAALVELLLLDGEEERAIAVAEEVRAAHPIAPGDRLSLELDYLDLLPDRAACERAWAALANWLADPRHGAQASGTAWQRRGALLARRGEGDAATAAFLHAVSEWAREPGYDDQAAEAFFASRSAQAALGALIVADEARPLAASLRGSHETATSLTERLLRRGLRALINEQFPDAFRLLQTAVNVARRGGNLSDYFEATEALGDCLAATGKHAGDALKAYVMAGLPDKAKRMTHGGRADDVLALVSLTGPAWERRAAWAAIAACRTNLSDRAAATIAAAAFDCIEHMPPTAFPTNASYYALDALGWIVCAVPASARAHCLDLLRERLHKRLGDPRHLADPFQMVTAAGLADESELILDLLLTEEAGVRVTPSQMADMLETHREGRDRLAAAAADGHAQALETLAFADAIDDDPQLLERARARVTAAIEAPLRHVSKQDGTRTVRVGLGSSLAPEGLLARSCPKEVRRAFVDKLVATLRDDDLPLMTRVGAVEGLHNLSGELPSDRVAVVVERLGDLATADDRPSRFDRLGVDEPLARFKVDMAPPHVLRASAIEALGVLAPHFSDAEALLRPALAPALNSGEEPLIVSSLRVLARNPGLIPPGFEAGSLLISTSPQVRVAALGVLVNSDPRAGLAAARMLIGDPDPYVRRQLLFVAVHLGDDGRPLLQALAEDRDCFLRAMARFQMDQR
jgi:tetratricopeptide (TPR) repeat protein